MILFNKGEFMKTNWKEINEYIKSQQRKYPNCIIQYGCGCNKPHICISEDFTSIFVTTFITDDSIGNNYIGRREYKLFNKTI